MKDPSTSPFQRSLVAAQGGQPGVVRVTSGHAKNEGPRSRVPEVQLAGRRTRTQDAVAFRSG